MDLIILYFRDGVGEGQFNQVLNIELDQMVKVKGPFQLLLVLLLHTHLSNIMYTLGLM